MSGCEHCSHPMWAGIKCSQCGRWYDECGTCGKRGNLPCEECMKADLKQAWDNYQEALKEFDCPRCGHCCREWKGLTDEEAAACWSTSAVETWKAIEAALKEKNHE